MERLLYVALTRAKHTLVLAFDRQFFRNARGQFHRNSQISWLRAGEDECNCQVMAALSSEARECPETCLRQKSAPRERVSEHLGKRELGWVDDARRQGVRFVHTISPSKFAPEEETGFAERADVWIEIEPELRPPRIDGPATRYGLWWHEFAQKIPWHSQPDAWQATFDENVVDSPDPARSKREWMSRNVWKGLLTLRCGVRPKRNGSYSIGKRTGSSVRSLTSCARIIVPRLHAIGKRSLN